MASCHNGIKTKGEAKLCRLVTAVSEKCFVVDWMCCHASVSLFDVVMASAVGARLAEHLPVNCHSNTKVSTCG